MGNMLDKIIHIWQFEQTGWIITNLSANWHLRNSNGIHTIRSNTSLYHISFLPSTLRQWNSLPTEVWQLNTLSSFKTSLKKDLQSVQLITMDPEKPKSFMHDYVQAAVL